MDKQGSRQCQPKHEKVDNKTRRLQELFTLIWSRCPKCDVVEETAEHLIFPWTYRWTEGKLQLNLCGYLKVENVESTMLGSESKWNFVNTLTSYLNLRLLTEEVAQRVRATQKQTVSNKHEHREIKPSTKKNARWQYHGVYVDVWRSVYVCSICAIFQNHLYLRISTIIER